MKRFALLAAVVLTLGCGRPPDEAWLRFLGFNVSSSGAPAAINGLLRDGKSMTVNVSFQNTSENVGQEGGVGAFIYRARVEYRMPGSSPPSAEFPLTLYVPFAATETLAGFPIASASLKSWVLSKNPGASVVELSARATFFAESDQGSKIETHGSVGIVLGETTDIPPPAACSCSSNLKNCPDFANQASAQQCYDKCILEVGIDIHELDGEPKDGKACNSVLPCPCSN